ncbi:MAG: DUF1552 domain-containing protein [Polyangiaceae bacterium]|nr:DUF1552 domain-containing protein [Polyangiaceae bacterium]
MSHICLNRRSFLASLGGGALIAAPFFRNERLAQAQANGPQRFMIMYFSNGRVKSQWAPTGSGTSYSLSPTLSPFEKLKGDLTVLEGIDGAREGNSEPHAHSMVKLTTGLPIRHHIAASQSTGPSIDQILAGHPAISTRIRSLQVTADLMINPNAVGQYVLSHAGLEQPLRPEVRPQEIYKQVFSGILGPSAGSGAPDPALERARAEKLSVLDFFKRDWQRMYDVLPAAQRPKLDAHLAGIRQIEKSLDAMPTTLPSAGCVEPTDLQSRLASIQAPPNPDTLPVSYASLSRLNLDLVRLAFACDATRIVTFLWDTSTSSMTFDGLLPGGRHDVQHGLIGNTTVLAASEKYLMQKTADWVQTLKDTPEGAGNLLDSSLVVVCSEHGEAHDDRQQPFLLLGTAGGRLKSGHFVTKSGRYNNDVWATVQRAFDMPGVGDTFGEAQFCQGPIPELLA